MSRRVITTFGIGLSALASLLLAACEPVPQVCIDDTSPTGSSTRLYPQARCGLDFTVSVPATCSSGGCGLIVDVHGFSMDANIQDRNTNIRRIGGNAGFVVAQPTAQVGESGAPSFSIARDAGVIADFAREAIDAFSLDDTRVHVGGFSQGGVISFFSACNFPDLYASVAPIAGGFTNDCFANGPPIPILQTNGVNDDFANFAGASSTRSAVVAGMGLTLADGVTVRAFPGIIQTRFENARGQLFEFIEYDFVGATFGAGHCFPGSFETALGIVGPGIGFARFACDDDHQLRIGEAIVEFYLQNPKR